MKTPTIAPLVPTLFLAVMTLAHFPGRDPSRMAAWQAPRGMRGWLTDDSSLTARIRSRCGR